MKIVFHKDCCKVYSSDRASAPGRMETIVKEVEDFESIEPTRATEEDVLVFGFRKHLGFKPHSKDFLKEIYWEREQETLSELQSLY